MTMTSIDLLIVGPQGSGKGTQGVRIAAALGIVAVSTGDMFRAAIRDSTPLGRQVKALIDAGDLVPDALTGAVVRERLAHADAAAGVLLDGYPRNIGQVADLDGYLAEHGRRLDAVIVLEVPRAESVARIGRRAHQEGRSDDTDEVIAHRLEIYERETEPILDVYAERGIVVCVDGLGTFDDVEARVLTALAARGIAQVPAT
jgi:adenylate kinase